MNPHICGQFVFEESVKVIQLGEKIFFQQMVLKQVYIHMEELMCSFPNATTKIN